MMAVERPALRMTVVLVALAMLSIGFSWWRGDSLATTAAYVAAGLACAGLVYAAYFWSRREKKARRGSIPGTRRRGCSPLSLDRMKAEPAVRPSGPPLEVEAVDLERGNVVQAHLTDRRGQSRRSAAVRSDRPSPRSPR